MDVIVIKIIVVMLKTMINIAKMKPTALTNIMVVMFKTKLFKQYRMMFLRVL